MDKWKAGYIERCTSGLGGGKVKPTGVTLQGAPNLPHEFIQTVRELSKKSMHLICGIRKDGRKYLYKGDSFNAKELQSVLKNEGQEKRCRKRNTRYFEAVVDYEGIGQVKLYFCRFPYQKKWRV